MSGCRDDVHLYHRISIWLTLAFSLLVKSSSQWLLHDHRTTVLHTLGVWHIWIWGRVSKEGCVCCLLHNFVYWPMILVRRNSYTCCLKVKRRKHDNERGISTASGIRIHINLPIKSERGHPIIRSIPYYQSKDQYLQRLHDSGLENTTVFISSKVTIPINDPTILCGCSNIGGTDYYYPPL